MSQEVEQSEPNNIEEKDMNEQEKIEQFDWNSKALTFNTCRSCYDSTKLSVNLMRVLILPTIDLFLPVLAEVGFPDYLIQHPDVWKSIFAEFTVLYNKALNDSDEWYRNIGAKYRARLVEIYELNPGIDRDSIYARLRPFDISNELIEFHVDLKAWRDVLEMLSAKAGEQVARELEKWMYYHYFSDKFNDAVLKWWIILTQTDELPMCLTGMEYMIEELDTNMADLIDESNMNDKTFYLDRQFDRKVDQLYAQYINESSLTSNSSVVGYYYIPEPTGDYRRPPYIPDYEIIKDAWIKNRTMPILQEFASRLYPDEIEIVVEWAREYCEIRTLGDPDELYPDDLITTKTLFLDFPSVLDTYSSTSLG
jgi:hypothetical protein